MKLTTAQRLELVHAAPTRSRSWTTPSMCPSRSCTCSSAGEVALTLHDGERVAGTLVFDPRAGDYENTVMVRRVVPRELIATAAITEDDEPPAERTP